MRKILLFVFFAISILTSCSNDDDKSTHVKEDEVKNENSFDYSIVEAKVYTHETNDWLEVTVRADYLNSTSEIKYDGTSLIDITNLGYNGTSSFYPVKFDNGIYTVIDGKWKYTFQFIASDKIEFIWYVENYPKQKHILTLNEKK